MKAYRQTAIRQAEIAQVILLHRLYMQPGSHDLIFQGGTASAINVRMGSTGVNVQFSVSWFTE